MGEAFGKYDKLLKWCAYRERCTFEVKEKCHRAGIDEKQTQIYIERLIADGYVDDKRFARLYAHSHASIKKWGKKKIEAELKKRQIDVLWIAEALESIEDESYQNTLYRIAAKKWQTIKENHPYKKEMKLRAFLYQKGYSHADISDVVKKIEPPSHQE